MSSLRPGLLGKILVRLEICICICNWQNVLGTHDASEMNLAVTDIFETYFDMNSMFASLLVIYVYAGRRGIIRHSVCYAHHIRQCLPLLTMLVTVTKM